MWTALAPTEMHIPSGREASRSALRSAAAGLFVHPPVGAQLVVLLPLIGIAKDFVRFVNFLDAILSRLVARVDVGMVLPRQLAKGLLDLFFGRGLRHAERLVIVLEVHDR